MDDQRYQRYDFNHGRSAIVLAFLQVNQAWIVFREDAGALSGNQRIWESYPEAIDDFRDRGRVRAADE